METIRPTLRPTPDVHNAAVESQIREKREKEREGGEGEGSLMKSVNDIPTVWQKLWDGVWPSITQQQILHRSKFWANFPP